MSTEECAGFSAAASAGSATFVKASAGQASDRRKRLKNEAISTRFHESTTELHPIFLMLYPVIRGFF